MSGAKLKNLRQQSGISGYLVSQRSGIARSRLSEIERQHVEPRASEVERIERAIEELIKARREVSQVAERVGWPL